MKFKYNNNEKNAVKGMLLIISLLELFRQVISMVTPEELSYIKQPMYFVTFVATMAIIYFGKEKVFSFVFKYIPAVRNENITGENWNIKITFKEADKDKVRAGMVTIKNTINGVRLIGGQLIDINNKKKTMNHWFSESAEIIKFDNHAVLYYIYKIPGDSEKHKKIGFVYAIKKDDADCFEGFFYDMRTNEVGTEALRSGEVEIYLEQSS